MNAITIPKQNDDLVIISKKTYEAMKSRMFPVSFLSGRSAKRVDERVNQGLKDFKKGNLSKARSLADML